MSEAVMTGNEAIARGFYEAGGVVATSYPGSPTVEILEKLKDYDEIYSEFSTNEKVAFEVAIGASFHGVPTMVSMKHVGVNIAADPLMTFTQTPVNGGFLLVSGDDPGLTSSQNEQDNRFFGKFANIGVVDPADGEEAKNFTKKALEISGLLKIPMLLRITSRLCHSRGIVTLGDREKFQPPCGIPKEKELLCMIPNNARKAQIFMKERLDRLEELAYETEMNRHEIRKGSKTLIITSGLVYNNLKEVDQDASIWKLGLVYPISKKKALEITSLYSRVIVIEEMQPFIENELKLMGINCQGKDFFSFTGELDVIDIKEGLYKAGLVAEGYKEVANCEVVPRTPLFCSGCPHRPIFDMLRKLKAKIVIGDIGCYSLAALFPFQQSNSIISMGASVGIAKGMMKAMSYTNTKEAVVAVIGDGTFFHSGLSPFINLLHNKKDNENMTFIILDNRTTAMTGGQPTGSSGIFNEEEDLKISISGLLQAMGHTRIKEVDQYDYKATQQILKEEVAHEGLSIIIANGPCALKYKMREPFYYVDTSICIGCRSCIKTNCPPLKMKNYAGIEKLKSYIDADFCVGCSICSQVCPVNAIKSTANMEKEV